ncbi:MAG: septum formation initiator family protein [Hydrotalea sp.]|nr:septum formation initiator family protein [Hydrotalea sp.]
MILKSTAFLLFLLLLFFGMFHTASQTYRLFKKREEIRALQAEAQQWQEKNKILGGKVKSLDGNNPNKDLLEELAREKLGYNYPNERRLKE